MKSKVQTYIALPLAPDPEPARQPSLQARAFLVAFDIPTDQTAALATWTDQANAALAAVVNFRSACRRWQAVGCIDETEFSQELEALDKAGLAGFLDNLVARAMEVSG